MECLDCIHAVIDYDDTLFCEYQYELLLSGEVPEDCKEFESWWTE